MGLKAEVWSDPVEGLDELLLGNPCPGVAFSDA